MTSFVESLESIYKKPYIDTRGDIMLDIDQQITRGITFIRLEGELTTTNYYRFAEEVNYLLYSQGMLAYVFNLENIKKLDNNLLGSIQNKLTEIFLKCGTVAFCGLSEKVKKKIGKRDALYFIKEEREVFQYINI